MTTTVISQYTCDVCGEDVAEATRFAGNSALAFPTQYWPGAQFRPAAGGRLVELCQACAQPLIEALQQRVDTVHATGHLRAQP